MKEFMMIFRSEINGVQFRLSLYHCSLEHG
jgi:hypothetical protein